MLFESKEPQLSGDGLVEAPEVQPPCAQPQHRVTHSDSLQNPAGQRAGQAGMGRLFIITQVGEEAHV